MKCVILIDEHLPRGLIANCASVLSLTLGKKIDSLIGKDLLDVKNRLHAGITTMPIPILKSNLKQLRELRNVLYEDKYKKCLVVDFTNTAQTSKTYVDYKDKLISTKLDKLDYLGIAVYGSKKIINSLVGSIGLLR